MPGRDRTGPAGMGPMTGRGWGDCASLLGSGKPARRHGGLCLLAGLAGLGMLCIFRKRKR